MDVSGAATNGLLLAQGRTQHQLSNSVRKLASGLRVLTAADDPSGLAIAESLQAKVNGLDQGARNIQDASNMVNVADGALQTITEILQRMRVLATAAASDILSATDKSDLQTEIDQLRSEIDQISERTTFNGRTLLDGSASSASAQPPRVVFIQNDALSGGGGARVYDSLYDPAQPAAQQIVPDPAIGFESVWQKVTVDSYDPTNDWLNVTITAIAFAPGANLNNPAAGQAPSNINVATGVPIGNNNFGIPGPPGTGSPPTPGTATFQQADFQPNASGITPIPVLSFNLGNLTAGDVGKTGILITIPPTTKAPGAAIEVNSGSAEGATVSVDIKAVNATSLGLVNLVLGSTVDQAQAVETYIDYALQTVTSERATLGAQAVSLSEAATNNAIASVNTQASESAIRDLNVASEVADLVKSQILTSVQTGILRNTATQFTSLLQLVATAAV